jgi:hypothetical protein
MNSSPHPTLLRRLAALVLIFVAGLLASCADVGQGSYNGGAPLARARSSDAAGSRTEPLLEQRAGLATTAGASTRSEVNETQFHRRAGAGPDGTDSFFYNDELGARTLMGALGGSRKHSGLFPVAGGRLRVGLTSPRYGFMEISGYDELPYMEADGSRAVIGRLGQPYGIRVKNVSSARLEIVLSVDGLGVRDGKTASVKRRGYVLEPGEEDTIRGFRTDDESVRQFVFGTVAQSEAAKKGQARNVGVIGVAVYEEDEATAKAARLEEALRRAGAKPFQ